MPRDDDPDAFGVVLSYRVWRNDFGGREAVIGSALTVNGHRAWVAGVLPGSVEGLYLGRAVDVWMPFQTTREARVTALGRLGPGATVANARTELAALAGDGRALAAMPYAGVEPEVQQKLARVKLLLQWAVALVFLTAAANLAGFLLSRSARRGHETAARVALGATRGRLASQIFAESLVIAIAGGAFGVVVAYWTASVLPALLYREDAARLRLTLEPAGVAATAALYAGLMLVCSLAPMTQVGRYGPMTVLRRSGDGGSTSVGWLRSTLAAAQMAVCVVLVIGTALLFQGFRQALRTARGDRLGEPIVAVLDAGARFARPDAGRDYYARARGGSARRHRRDRGNLDFGAARGAAQRVDDDNRAAAGRPAPRRHRDLHPLGPGASGPHRRRGPSVHRG